MLNPLQYTNDFLCKCTLKDDIYNVPQSLQFSFDTCITMYFMYIDDSLLNIR